jgi:hypothetical protein
MDVDRGAERAGVIAGETYDIDGGQQIGSRG